MSGIPSPLSFDFLALPPEVNSARLISGPGSAPMLATAAAYSRLAGALTLAAGGSDGSMNSMSATWQGPSSERAQSAFRNHASWLREQAAVATETAARTTAAAAAYEVALATMPPLPVIIANRAAGAALAATNHMGQNTAAIAMNEAVYMVLWAQAATSMAHYAGQTVAAVGALPDPPTAPSIVSGGGGADPGAAQAYENLIPRTDPSITGDRPAADPVNHPTTTDTGPADQQPGNPGGDPGKPTPDPSDPTPEATQPHPAEQAVSEVDRAMSSLSDSLADPSAEGSGASVLEQHGFAGTSPYSTTLTGLSGGVGSLVTLGMARGGLGAMPGASTGFRMPSNWSLGRGTAFGAGANPTAASAAPRNAPPRGATAPKAQMRRRRREEDRAKSTVFVPGEPQDVPVLERPPVIGVIEYADERPEETTEEQAVPTGVLSGSDDDPEWVVENVPGDAHRGRD